jgi:hypothetical protein
MSDSTKTDSDAWPNLSKFMDRMVTWMKKITTPEFAEFQRQRLGYVLADDFARDLVFDNPVDDFKFSKEIEEQHDLIMSVFHLHSSAEAHESPHF